MTATSTSGPLEAARQIDVFRGLIAGKLGLELGESRRSELSDLLADRISLNRCETPHEYFHRLMCGGALRDEWRLLAERLIVTETYFFRNPAQFRALADLLLQDLRRSRSGSREIRILSAGCASGEEPYTVAMLWSEIRGFMPGFKATIHALDVHGNCLEKARAAQYSKWSLRQIPPSWIDKYFRLERGVHCLRESVRSLVSFEERNLLDLEPGLAVGGAFDVIFCRNVIMYFSPDTGRKVITLISKALNPGGYLFLGHAETLRGISKDFNLVQSHDTFYYTRRSCTTGVDADPVIEAQGPVSGNSPESRADGGFENEGTPATCAADQSWLDVIGRASQKIASLSRSSGSEPRRQEQSPKEAERQPAKQMPWELAPARRALQEEQFEQALKVLSNLPPEAEQDPETLLLRAVILVNRGDLDRAEADVGSIFHLDDLNPGAHYVMALCCENRGNTSEALRHYRSVIYLDPTFAMAHFHIGKLARRQGDSETARRRFECALNLFHGEDAGRILLFGGGFQRAALVGLCRAELRALGGSE